MKKYIIISCCLWFGLMQAQAQINPSAQLSYTNARGLNIHKNNNPIEAHLFKPELVMKHQRALKLSTQQKEAILNAYQKAQAEFTRWQWDLQASTEELSELVAQNKIEEQKALQHLEKMLDLERNIKRTQLGLMIKIKNQLTSTQQKKLRELEEKTLWGGSVSRSFTIPKVQGYRKNRED